MIETGQLVYSIIWTIKSEAEWSDKDLNNHIVDILSDNRINNVGRLKLIKELVKSAVEIERSNHL